MHLKYIFYLLALMIGIPTIGFAVDIEAKPIHYWTRPSNDRLAQLQRRLESGEVSLKAPTSQEALRKLLHLLEVPVESQILVYSKTSAQNSRISPETPRAIYFSDNCYVGWVQHGSIEVIAFDEHLGAVLYLVDITRMNEEGNPPIERPQSCLNCHQRSSTSDVPGTLARSVFPSESGLPFFGAGSFYVDDSTPLKNRWGGWYVTGDSGDQIHMGNSLAIEDRATDTVSLHPMGSGIQVEHLSDILNTKPYLTNTSDIVALMIFEHQVNVHNLLVESNLTVRQQLHRSAEIQKIFGEPADEEPEGVLKSIIESRARKIVEALLFREEHLLEGMGVEGGEAFADAFAQTRRPASDGRALKDLRLYERLFKFRCSYLIYSEVFDHLPAVLKQQVYRELLTALTGPNGTELSDHLSWTERERIRDILAETKNDLPSDWPEPED